MVRAIIFRGGAIGSMWFIMTDRAKVKFRNQNIIDLYVKPGSDTARRERAMLEWYRCLLKQQIPPLLEKWASDHRRPGRRMGGQTDEDPMGVL